jgi:hypothetical protein
MRRELFPLVAGLGLVFGLTAAAEVHAASTTLFYPTQDAPSFSLVVPGDWELEQAEEDGGFATLNGPSGAQLSFRTVAAEKEDLEAAIEETVDWVQKNYDDVKIEKATDAEENGLKGFSSAGTGKMKEDGSAVVFVMEWLMLNNGSLAEVWFCVDVNDKAGLAAAGKIMKSFRAR